MAIKGIRPLMRRARALFSRASADQASTTAVEQSTGGEIGETKGAESTDNVTPIEINENLKDAIPTEGLQHGVSDAEAVTLTWSKTTLIAVFIKYG